MIGLLRFVLAILASPFKSKIRLEAEKCGAPPSADCFAAQDAWPRPTRKQRSLVLRPDAPVSRQIQRIGSIKSHAILGGLITTTSGFKFSVHTGMHLCRQTKDRSRAKSRTC